MNKFIMLTWASKEREWVSDTFWLNSSKIVSFYGSKEIGSSRLELDDGQELCVKETEMEIVGALGIYADYFKEK